MRYSFIILIVFIAGIFSCEKQVIQTDLSLDELDDKGIYTSTMLVDCSMYMEKNVDRLLVNGSENDDPDVLELKAAGYYRLEIYPKQSNDNSPEVIRLVILDAERGEAEWGLPPWTPAEAKSGSLNDQAVRLIYPSSAPAGFFLPLVVLVGEELGLSDSNLNAKIGSTDFRIKRGVGSLLVPVNINETVLSIDHRNFLVNVNSMNESAQLLSGELSADTHIPAGSYINITSDLIIPEGITLSIGSGCFISVEPEVNIINNGLFYCAGTVGSPVVVTCSDNEAYWGGLIGTVSGNRVEARFTIFNRSGHHTGGDYNYGHAHRQALFYSENGEVVLDHCYMTDHIGQVFFSESSTLKLTDCLVQRAKTGGQLNVSELWMNRCVFTDFPDDSNTYRDEDNDGLYLSGTNASIKNSIFMYAKDDGLDSGSSGGGEVSISNCRFESIFHEGAALSSGHSSVKLHQIKYSLFTNCGQGLELGYSSPNHKVEVDSCRFIANGIGVRYGDCYASPHRGYMHVANSESLENRYHDVWNMNREHWEADTAHLSFDHVTVSTPNPMYPELIVNE